MEELNSAMGIATQETGFEEKRMVTETNSGVMEAHIQANISTEVKPALVNSNGQMAVVIKVTL